MRSGFVRTVALLAVLALTAGLVFAACNGDDDDDVVVTPTPDNGEPVDGIDISGVPELQDGVLTVGSDIAYAPMEFFQPGTDTPDGFSIDLGNAIGELFGVDVQFINSDFDGIIPSLTTGEFDILITSMTITEDRLERIDFVPYANVGTGILVESGNPHGIQSLDDLCGLTVAVQIGTIQVDMIDEQNEVCDEPINMVTFDLHPLAVSDLRTGGADVVLGDFPVVFIDAEESEGALEVLDVQIDPEPYGIGVRQDSEELKAALEEAMQALRDSSRYMEILEKWDLESIALD
jgi:polar amino acid transport system substrate-binding protein